MGPKEMKSFYRMELSGLQPKLLVGCIKSVGGLFFAPGFDSGAIIKISLLILSMGPKEMKSFYRMELSGLQPKLLVGCIKSVGGLFFAPGFDSGAIIKHLHVPGVPDLFINSFYGP